MDKLLQYASCNSIPVEDLLLLNSCNSLDTSNIVVAGEEDAMNDTSSVSEPNNDTKDCAASGHNNTRRTTARPVPVAFRNPRPALGNVGFGCGGGGVCTFPSIPRRTGILESKIMMIQKPKGDDDDDENNIDASSKRPAITKSHVASSTKTLGTASSSSLSSVSSQILYYVHA
jgi:hypothetical protein